MLCAKAIVEGEDVALRMKKPMALTKVKVTTERLDVPIAYCVIFSLYHDAGCKMGWVKGIISVSFAT